jgi:PTS system mannose-specific IIA component
MIGIVIVTHGKLADSLIETAEIILGSRPDAITSVSINLIEDTDKHREKVARAIKSVNRKNGILIFTDMFGGSPSNVSYSFLEKGQIEVVSGVNLPMLIKAIESRERMKLEQLAENLEASGKRSISIGSNVLQGNLKN